MRRSRIRSALPAAGWVLALPLCAQATQAGPPGLSELGPGLPMVLGLWLLARGGTRYARPGGSSPRSWRRRAVAAAGLAALLAALATPSVARAAPINGLVISEVLYNPAGADDGREWIELFNGMASAVDLSTWSLGWGGVDYTTGQLQLAGSIAPGQYLVVGGPQSDAGNGNPSYGLAVDLGPDLENAFLWVADGVALFDRPAAAVTASTVPVDAVLYGWPGAGNWNGLLDETGAPGAVDAFTFAAGSSIERTDLGWQLQATPTPGSGPLTSGSAVPESSPALGILLGLSWLARRHRSSGGSAAASDLRSA